MRADFDFAQACMAAARGELRQHPDELGTGFEHLRCAGFGGVSGKSENEDKRSRDLTLGRVRAATERLSFMRGTRREDSSYYTSGGRVLGVSASGENLDSASSFCVLICVVVCRLRAFTFGLRHREAAIKAESSNRSGDYGMGEVLNLFVCFVHRFPMKELGEAEAVQNKGLKGCIHGRPGSKRQVSLMDVETSAEVGLSPGADQGKHHDARTRFSGARTGPVRPHRREPARTHGAMQAVHENG